MPTDFPVDDTPERNESEKELAAVLSAHGIEMFKPTPAEIRSAEIEARLEQIDHDVIRPMRAKLAGTATEEDEVILVELEHEAKTLREELDSLAGGERK